MKLIEDFVSSTAPKISITASLDGRRKRRRKGDRRTVYRSTHPLAKKVLSAAFPKRRELREVRNGNRLLCFRGTVENSRPPGLVCVFEIVKFELYTTL